METKNTGTRLTKELIAQSADPRKTVSDEIDRLFTMGYRYEDIAAQFNLKGITTFSRGLAWTMCSVGTFARKMGTWRKTNNKTQAITTTIPVVKQRVTTVKPKNTTVNQAVLVQEIIDVVTAPMSEAYKVRLIRDIITNGLTA